MKRCFVLIFSFILAVFVVAMADMHVLDMRHGLSESRIRKIYFCCLEKGTHGIRL